MAIEPNSFSEMPKSCQIIQSEELTFELPLSTQKLTSEQQKKIRVIIDEVRTQACILQMKYDGLLQQIIAMLLENVDVSDEQLKSFYDQILSLTENSTENKIKTVSSIRKLLSEAEWQDLILAYTHFAVVKNDFIESQIKLQQSYNALMSGDPPNEFTTTSLIPTSFCVKNDPKIKMLEQIMSKLSLTDSQEGIFLNTIWLEQVQTCSAKQNISRHVEQFLQLLMQQADQIQAKQYKAVFNQLVSKAYLQEIYQIKSLSSLFQILTAEQKTQIREKYMLLKGVL